MALASSWLEEAFLLLVGFSYLQILGSVVVGVSLYLAIKLWNGQLKWSRITQAVWKKKKKQQSQNGPFEE